MELSCAPYVLKSGNSFGSFKAPAFITLLLCDRMFHKDILQTTLNLYPPLPIVHDQKQSK
jgi:hypothetical protein